MSREYEIRSLGTGPMNHRNLIRGAQMLLDISNYCENLKETNSNNANGCYSITETKRVSVIEPSRYMFKNDAIIT